MGHGLSNWGKHAGKLGTNQMLHLLRWKQRHLKHQPTNEDTCLKNVAYILNKWGTRVYKVKHEGSTIGHEGSKIGAHTPHGHGIYAPTTT